MQLGRKIELKCPDAIYLCLKPPPCCKIFENKHLIKRSLPTFPTPFLPTPLHALIDCCVVEVCNLAKQLNLTAKLQFTCASKAPLLHKFDENAPTKCSCPTFPTPILPVSLHALVDCGVIEVCNWEEQLNSTIW
jgi:hypothetical protein